MERDRAAHQLATTGEQLRAQVAALTEEAGRLRARATEAAAQVEAEVASRRSAELALAQAQASAESRQAALNAAQANVASLSCQLEESGRLLEAARGERNREQSEKWAAEEEAARLSTRLEEAITEHQTADMERCAAVERAQADARAAAATVKSLQTSLGASNTQISTLKAQVGLTGWSDG